MKPQMQLLLDSGAYSAFTQGKEVDLRAYCAFILKNRECIADAVNLDVIDPKGPEVAAAAGMRNFKEMLASGIMSIPVFHARERTKWLDEMMDLGAEYIGLSGTSLVSPTEHLAWYDLIWGYATDNDGCAIANFHAFGDTAPYSLLTYPWYSADSATWMIQAGRAARVKLNGGSFQLRSRSRSDANYISNDDPTPKKEAWELAIRNLGLDPDVVMSVTAQPSELAMIRSYLVASDLLELQKKSASCTKFKKPVPLIGKKKQATGGGERVGPVHLHFVISPSAWSFNFPILAALGVKDILVSYFYVASSTPKFWEERMVPFLYDPVGFCERDPKLRKFWDKLQECILKTKPLLEAV